MNSIAKIIVGVGTILAAIWIGFYVGSLGEGAGEEWYHIPAFLTCIAIGVGGGILAENGLREEGIIE